MGSISNFIDVAFQDMFQDPNFGYKNQFLPQQ